VTLNITGSDSGGGTLSQMQFSYDNITYSAAEAFATTKVWTLTTGDALKSLYLRLIDSVGNSFTTASPTSITLDTVAPTITSVLGATPSSSTTTNVSHLSSNPITVVFADTNGMDQTTMTTNSGGTGTIQLEAAGNSAVIVGSITAKTATSATFKPTSNLLSGTQYKVVTSTGLKDVAGNPVAAATSTTFTTEDDVYENTSAGSNDLSANAFDLSTGTGSFSSSFNNSTWQQTLSVGGLGVLKNADIYKVTDSSPFTLTVRVYYTNSTSDPGTGAAAAAIGTNTLQLVVQKTGAVPPGGVTTHPVNSANDQKYVFDLSGLGLGSTVFYFSVMDGNGNYANPQTYNLVWSDPQM